MTKGTKNDDFRSFHVVWTKPRETDDRTLRPVKRTYLDMGRAIRAAENMAEKNPGRKFFVLTAMLRVQVKGGQKEVMYDPEAMQLELDTEGEAE